MTSKRRRPQPAYVWIWLPGLPGAVEPVVAGKLTQEGGGLLFNYGWSYLAREAAIPLYNAELPLKRGVLHPLSGLSMPGCIRDAAPDDWGRRVLLNRLMGKKGRDDLRAKPAG